MRNRIVTLLLVLLPWSVMYEYFIFRGTPEHPIYTNLPFEASWPVWEWTEIFYAFTYVYALSIPFILKSKQDLRQFRHDIWFATLVGGLIYWIFPFVVHQREFIPHNWLGQLILLERSADGETAALPSFHVIWAFVSARYFTIGYPQYRWAWYILAVLIALSCLTTASHSVLDVVAGFGVFVLIRYRQLLAERLTIQ